MEELNRPMILYDSDSWVDYGYLMHDQEVSDMMSDDSKVSRKDKRILSA